MSKEDSVVSKNVALDALCEAYWMFSCKAQPMNALLAGEQIDEPVLYRESPEDHTLRADGARELLKRCDALNELPLVGQEAATFELLRDELKTLVALYECDAHLRPSLFPATPDFNLSYVASAVPVSSSEQAERYLALLHSAPGYIDDLCESLLEGKARGYRNAASALQSTATAISANLGGALRESLLKPLRRYGKDTAESVLIAHAEKLIDGDLSNALDALVQTLRGPLLKAARNEPGLFADQEGEALYRVLCRQFTSLDDDPASIHELGLAEVERLTAEQAALAAEAGYANDLLGYRQHLQSDRSYFAENVQVHLNTVRALCKRIDGAIPDYFATLPRVTYGVELIPEAMADSTPPAYAQPAPADTSRPGIFWLTPQLDKCPRYLYPSLALHEAWPGHLMQIALMQEQSSLPAFRRNGALKYTACVEGWAMYCEWLGEEMGIYLQNEERFGRLNMEMWRAVRLVVDTGIHLYGWSRERAQAYMTEHVALPAAAISSEVDRYIALPGQALAYQLGNLTLRGLRRSTEHELGDCFSLRDFHDQLIRSGPVSLRVLERLTREWTDAQRERFIA